MRFLEEAMQALAPVAVRYGLDVVPVGDDAVLLAGPNFAIQILADFDVVHTAYVEVAPGGEPRMVGLDTYLQDQRFTPEDRAQFGQPVGRTGHVLAALRVVVSGLSRRCDDILRGDRQWLRRLRDRDPYRWRGGSPSPSIAAAIREHFGFPADQPTLASRPR